MKKLVPAVLVLIGVFATDAAAQSKVGKGFLYYNGTIVRTLVPPAANPTTGRDPLYVVPTQPLAVAGVAPGDPYLPYHGGHWAVYVVTWNVTPYLLTSRQMVLAAAAAGHVNLTRMPQKDFRCPILP